MQCQAKSKSYFARRFTLASVSFAMFSVSGFATTQWWIFERGVQVQADYGNSMDCFIMAGEYVYAEAVKSEPIHVKHGKCSEFWTFEIASAGFSGPIQRALVRRSLKLLHLFHRPCGANSFLLLMACQTYYDFTATMPTNFYRTAFVIKRICSQN